MRSNPLNCVAGSKPFHDSQGVVRPEQWRNLYTIDGMGAQTMSFIPGTAKSRVADFGSRSSSPFSKALLVTLL